MRQHDSNAVEGTETDQLDERDVRALEQYLTVLPEAPDVYSVVSESGKSYTVDARAGVCTCPDHEYRGVTCKHLRRVAFATGERPIPASVDPETIDDQLGIHLPDGGRTPLLVADGGRIIDAGDEGEVVAEHRASGEQYTYHREPLRVGGERYVRCETCNAEGVPADPDRLSHKEGCPHGDGR